MKTLLHILFIGILMSVASFFLFNGILAEQDRRDGMKSNRQWLHKMAVNQMETGR